SPLRQSSSSATASSRIKIMIEIAPTDKNRIDFRGADGFRSVESVGQVPTFASHPHLVHEEHGASHHDMGKVRWFFNDESNSVIRFFTKMGGTKGGTLPPSPTIPVIVSVWIGTFSAVTV